jgi:hypothetical protein
VYERASQLDAGLAVGFVEYPSHLVAERAKPPRRHSEQPGKRSSQREKWGENNPGTISGRSDIFSGDIRFQPSSQLP